MVLNRATFTQRRIVVGAYAVLAILFFTTIYTRHQSTARMEQEVKSLKIQLQILKDQAQQLKDRSSSKPNSSNKEVR